LQRLSWIKGSAPPGVDAASRRRRPAGDARRPAAPGRRDLHRDPPFLRLRV